MKEIKTGKIYLFTYEKEKDDFILDEYINQFKKFGKKNNLDFYLYYEADLLEIYNFALQKSFFSGKIIYLKNIVKTTNNEAIKILEDLYNQIKDDSDVILLIDKQKKLDLNRLEILEHISVENGNEANSILKLTNYINANSFKIKREDLIYLYNLCNKDTLKTKFELEKLFLLCYEITDEIERSDINKLNFIPKEFELYKLLESLFFKKENDVFKTLESLVVKGSTEEEIFNSIAKGIHDLYFSLISEKRDNYFLEKRYKKAQEIGVQKLKNIEFKLNEIEIKIRQYGLEKSTALQLIICYILAT